MSDTLSRNRFLDFHSTIFFEDFLNKYYKYKYLVNFVLIN